jgi:hypothetical protein
VSFADYVGFQAAVSTELPLVHTTECRHMASIQASHTLEPKDCKVFGEPLLYFFYGRPSYRDPSQTRPILDVAYCPLCFVFKPQRPFKIARMYPFDTGASQKGLYEPEIVRSNAIIKYTVAAAIESARQIIQRFFQTNENYLASRPSIGLTFSPGEVDVEAYYKLVTGGGTLECDDRRSAIEIQIKENIDLRDHLMAVVMPTHFLDDASLRKTLIEEWCAHPLTYDADLGMRPTEFHGNVRAMIRKYYKHWKLL